MDSFEIRKKIMDPEYQFNSEEISYIDNNYIELSYYPIYKSMYFIQYFIRELESVIESENMNYYQDFGVRSWEKARLFTVELINTNPYSLDDLLSFLSHSFGIHQVHLLKERKYLYLIENAITLSEHLRLFDTRILPKEITQLIEERINTVSYSYLELVDVFNFIDILKLAFMGTLNEYNFYPIRILEKYELLNRKEDVIQAIIQCFNFVDEKGLKLQGINSNGFDFINVCAHNEHLKGQFKKLTLEQRLEIGAQMILEIKEKYPLLAQFHISRT